MSSHDWGDAYERIQALLDEGGSPAVTEAQSIAKSQMDRLTEELAALPPEERDAFAYTVCEEIVTLATEFLVLIRVQNGQCEDRTQASHLSDQLINEALAS